MNECIVAHFFDWPISPLARRR